METIQYIWNCHGWMLGVEHWLYTYWLTKSKSPQHEIWMKYGFENLEAWGHTALMVQMGETEEDTQSTWRDRGTWVRTDFQDELSISRRSTTAYVLEYIYLADASGLSVWHIGLQQLLKLNPPWTGVDVLGGDVSLLSKLRIMKSEMSWDATPHPTEKKILY